MSKNAFRLVGANQRIYDEVPLQTRPPVLESPPFFSAGETVQKKADPFFSHTPVNPFFTPIQRQEISEREEPIQAKVGSDQLAAPTAPLPVNNTGLPDELKAGVESLSGYSMDDVKVHYNSPQPTQLHAHAYAQGNQIYVAPGQEKHLPHETWHVVQQKQGRVKPTMQLKGKVNVNDDVALEREADVMGGKAGTINGQSSESKAIRKKVPEEVTQLKIEKGKVYGISHLVKMVDGSLYKEDFSTNEDRQINDGDMVEFETDSELSSRRGPNQEVEANNEADATGPQHYKWYLVKSVNKEAVGDSQYIRDDTFHWTKERSFDATEAVLDSIASGSGITGDMGDMALALPESERSSDLMGKHGGGGINNPIADIGEGVNIGLGLINLHGAAKKYQEGEKVEAVAQGLEGVGKIAHGGTKLTKGLASLKGFVEEGAGASKGWTQVGDVGAAIGDGLSTISSLILIVKNIGDAFTKHEEEGGLTGDEIVDAIAETGGNVASYFKAGMNTGKDILKAVTKVGEGSPAIQAEIAQFAQAAAIIGIIAGSIEIIHGGIKIGRGFYKNGQVQKVRKPIIDTLLELENEKIPAITGEIERKFGYLETAMASGPIPRESALIAFDNIEKIIDKLEEFEIAYKELEKFYSEYIPAMDAMRKIESRRMEGGAMKMAQGTTAVVSSALLLSGVGAPIAIGVSAIGGILTLGNIALQWRRDAAAGRVQNIASKLDDNGQPTGRIEPEFPGYRVLEDRMFKNYYLNLKSTLRDENFPRLSKDETVEVKRFGWGDKKARLKSEDRYDIPSVDAVDKVSYPTKRERWIQVKDSKGTVTHKEKPKGTTKFTAKITASAHKSKASVKASAEVIAEALYKLGKGSFENGKFKQCKVLPINVEKGVDMDQVTNQTSTVLLKTAGIDAKRWQAWLASTGGDADKMIEKIKNQVSL